MSRIKCSGNGCVAKHYVNEAEVVNTTLNDMRLPDLDDLVLCAFLISLPIHLFYHLVSLGA